MKNKLLLACSAALTLGMVSTQAAEGDSGAKVGMLVCDKLEGGYNVIVHSKTPVECIFKAGGGEERYKGEAGVGLGLDLEWDSEKTIAFAVLSAQSDTEIGSHSLAGKYTGASVSATVGVGVGAQILIGGGDNNFTLQPIALSGSKGFGAAAGLGYLSLEADKAEK